MLRMMDESVKVWFGSVKVVLRELATTRKRLRSKYLEMNECLRKMTMASKDK